MDKEKERAEWQLALDIQGEKTFGGMKEICSNMGDYLKSFMQTELGEIRRERGDLREGLQEMTQKFNKIESTNSNRDNEIQKLQEQSKTFQASLISLECKVIGNQLRLRRKPEKRGENTFEMVVDKIASYLGEQQEDVSFNLESV